MEERDDNRHYSGWELYEVETLETKLQRLVNKRDCQKSTLNLLAPIVIIENRVEKQPLDMS